MTSGIRKNKEIEISTRRWFANQMIKELEELRIKDELTLGIFIESAKEIVYKIRDAQVDD